MNRLLLVAVAAVLAGPAARAQYMPLRDLLLEGEGWKKVEGEAAKPMRPDALTVLNPTSWAGPPPFVAVRSPRGDTTFVGGFPGEIATYPVTKDGHSDIAKGAPYCTLRRGPKGLLDVTALTVDKDGRIYAATTIGVQVFDPTGRLCGVLHAPAPGKMESLAFEGNQLTTWVGDVKYTRKLNTTGVK